MSEVLRRVYHHNTSTPAASSKLCTRYFEVKLSKFGGQWCNGASFRHPSSDKYRCSIYASNHLNPRTFRPLATLNITKIRNTIPAPCRRRSTPEPPPVFRTSVQPYSRAYVLHIKLFPLKTLQFFGPRTTSVRADASA